MGNWTKHLRGYFGYLAILIVMGLISKDAMTLGVEVPSEDEDTRYLYQVENEKLYRYIRISAIEELPEGIKEDIEPETDPKQATKQESVKKEDQALAQKEGIEVIKEYKKDPFFLIRYSLVKNQLETEISSGIKKALEGYEKEKNRLKENDEGVKKIRAEIDRLVEELKAIDGKIEKHESVKISLEKAILKLDSQLSEIKKRIKQASSSEGGIEHAELLRLVELFNSYTQEKKNKKEFLEKVSDQLSVIVETNDNLALLLAEQTTLLSQSMIELEGQVTSELLVSLEKEKEALEKQWLLVPELDKRVRDSLAFPLEVWSSMGNSAVDPLVKRFERIADKLGGKRRPSKKIKKIKQSNVSFRSLLPTLEFNYSRGCELASV